MYVSYLIPCKYICISHRSLLGREVKELESSLARRDKETEALSGKLQEEQASIARSLKQVPTYISL